MSTVEKQPRGASAVQQFTIHIPDATLDEMYERLRRTRYPEDFPTTTGSTASTRPTFESSLTTGSLSTTGVRPSAR